MKHFLFLIYSTEACQLELCLLHQMGLGQALQEKALNEHVRFAYITKVIRARTMGEWLRSSLVQNVANG